MTNKPNILLLHCHDIGDHLGCYPGNSAQTPNLDRLAGTGVVFDQYFSAAPTCSPSRGAMFTGLVPHRNGLIGLSNGDFMHLDPTTSTIGSVVRELGYATAIFGIWHVSRDFRDFGLETGNGMAECGPAASNAVEYLKNRRTDKPFFLMVSFLEPHRIDNRVFTDRWPERQKPAEIIVPPYLDDAPEVREEMSRFYGDSSLMDASVGKILDYLDLTGLTGDTLVIFTSDHGIAMPLAKGTLYDPGIKIPLIIRWPNHIESGLRCNALSSNVDLFPTLLDALGKRKMIPEDLDGHSLWPFIENGEDVAHEQVFSEQTWHDFYEPIRAIRTQHHKFIRNFQPGTGLQVAADILLSDTTKVMRETLCDHPRPEYELYDLEEDPLERTNLAGQKENAELENDLKGQLDDWLEASNDPILKGVVPAPSGYREYFLASPTGPGGLPAASGQEEGHTFRRPDGAAECPE